MEMIDAGGNDAQKPINVTEPYITFKIANQLNEFNTKESIDSSEQNASLKMTHRDQNQNNLILQLENNMNQSKTVTAGDNVINIIGNRKKINNKITKKEQKQQQ